MVTKKQYKDKKGRSYNHLIIENKEMVFCMDKLNNVYKGNIDFFHREGKSSFGEQVVFEFLIKDKKTTYPSQPSKNGFNFVEIYMTPEEALDLFKEGIELIQGFKETTFNLGDWNKDLCEWCGEHNVCKNEKCEKYTWSKK